jgi:hypothetical protein
MNIQTSFWNLDDVFEFQKLISNFTFIFQWWDGVQELPPELSTCIETFVNALSAISTQCHDLMSCSTLRHLYMVTDDALKLSQLLRDIDKVVRKFQVLPSHFVIPWSDSVFSSKALLQLKLLSM